MYEIVLAGPLFVGSILAVFAQSSEWQATSDEVLAPNVRTGRNLTIGAAIMAALGSAGALAYYSFRTDVEAASVGLLFFFIAILWFGLHLIDKNNKQVKASEKARRSGEQCNCSCKCVATMTAGVVPDDPSSPAAASL